MEDKKLNFNQPFLSVRRYPAPTVTSRTSDERKSNHSHPLIPQLPPHRTELKSGPIRNPGAVPFLWEQTPGQPKEEVTPQTRTSDRPPVAPKLPPGRYPKANQQDSHSNGSERQNVENFESSKATADGNESSDSEDSDAAYVDALDSLSRTESFFVNCSMSGLSGLDDLDVRPPGSFQMDLQARESMMDRFLPAAKAMASESPQYAPNKQTIVQEQPQQLKKIVNQYKPSLRYGPSFAKRYSHYNDNEDQDEQEEEESDDDYDQHGSSPAVCGLIPRFCLKGSLGFLNHVPAHMSMRTRVQMSSANKVQPRSSSSGSYSETETESRSDRTEQKSIDKIRTAENASGHFKIRSTSSCGDEPQTFLAEKQAVAVPEKELEAENEDLGLHGKGLRTFQELLADQGSPKESNSGCPVIEKTLCVDTAQSVESPNSRSFSLTTQEIKDVPSSREEYDEIFTKRTVQMDAIDSSLQDFKKLNTLDEEEKLLSNGHKFDDSNIISSINKSTEKCRKEMARENIEATEKEAMGGIEKQLLSRAVITLENSHQNYSQLPIPPPLPNSPSDSWLWRTLPSMSVKNASLRSYLGAETKPQNQVSKDHSINTKWETIVKTTKVHHRHSHHSRESLTAIPET